MGIQTESFGPFNRKYNPDVYKPCRWQPRLRWGSFHLLHDTSGCWVLVNSGSKAERPAEFGMGGAFVGGTVSTGNVNVPPNSPSRNRGNKNHTKRPVACNVMRTMDEPQI